MGSRRASHRRGSDGLVLCDKEGVGLVTREDAVILDHHVFVGNNAVEEYVGADIGILKQDAILYGCS